VDFSLSAENSSKSAFLPNDVRRGQMPPNKELKPYQREVIRRAAMDQRSPEIGAAMGMSASNVRMIWRKPEAREYLSRCLEMIDLATGIAMKMLCIDAVRAYKDLLRQRDNLRVLFNVAQDVLDRAGVKGPPTP
jgi:hypothetical protein